MISYPDEPIYAPKLTMAKESMEAVDYAIQDNIVGITQEQADQYLKFMHNVETDITVVAYKGKPVLCFGFRRPIVGREEFFIEVANTVKA